MTGTEYEPWILYHPWVHLNMRFEAQFIHVSGAQPTKNNLGQRRVR